MSSPSTLKVFCESSVFLNEKTGKMNNLGIGIYIPDHDNKFNLSRSEKTEDSELSLKYTHIKAVVYGLEQALTVTEKYPNKYKNILVSSNFSHSEIEAILSSIVNERESKVLVNEINTKLINLVEKLNNIEIIWKNREIFCDDETAADYKNEAHIISYNASIEAVTRIISED